MPLLYNGAETIPRIDSESDKHSQKAWCRSSLDDPEETTKGKVFRGFEKVPTVSLQRIDISQYLLPSKRHSNGLNSDTSKKPSRENFCRTCTVNVVKDDLEMLRVKYLENPNDPYFNTVNMKCKICEKVYPNEKKLQNHQDNKHLIIKPKTPKRVSFSDTVIVHEVREYHKCRKCPKIFEDYRSLKLHMKSKHKKRKCYICDYCKKKFVDRSIFKVHIKLHCDVCSLLFSSKSTYLEHRRNVCRTIKMHKCKTCDGSFFNFMDLKDHSYEHLHDCFVCDICKDQFQSSCEMAHHTQFLHSDKRPTSLFEMRNLGTERLYLCNFCEESSVDKDLIEKHVETLPDLSNRAMTGYKDYYFCDQCLKKFETEQDMLQHKWSHFLKTSDNSQERPEGVLATKKFKITKTKYTVDNVPEHFKPVILLDKLKVGGKCLTESVPFVDVRSFDEHHGNIKKVVDPVSKKTLISKHQCEQCTKYFSSSYCLARHKIQVHGDYDNYQCEICEETFAWQSLLKTHRCIRLNHPEMPFDDARPEIFFENNGLNSFDDLNITDNDDYLNSVDFEIPAPIVELTEYEACYNFDRQNNLTLQSTKSQNVGNYKITMQEVPIEF